MADDDEVQDCVVAAVAAGLLDAKINEEKHQVVVDRTTLRSVTTETWSLLKERLQLWQQNIEKVLNVRGQSATSISS